MVFLVSDHGGWRKKEALREWLKQKHILVTDLGPATLRPGDDYPTNAKKLGLAVAKRRGSFGIAVCRTGVGMDVVANKIKGIRAVAGTSTAIVASARRDEHANVMTFGADRQTLNTMKRLVEVFLRAKPSLAKRVQRRLRQINAADHGR